MRLNPPQRAEIEAPPYDDIEGDVVAIEFDPTGSYPFKVWVEDGNVNQDAPFYATAVEFEDYDAGAHHSNNEISRAAIVAGVLFTLFLVAASTPYWISW